MTLGETLKKLRKKNGLTIEELSLKTKISTANISDYENNKVMPSMKNGFILSKTLGCTVEQLFEGIETINIIGYDNAQVVGVGVAKQNNRDIEENQKLLEKIISLTEKVNQLNEEIKREKDEKFQLLLELTRRDRNGGN